MNPYAEQILGSISGFEDPEPLSAGEYALKKQYRKMQKRQKKKKKKAEKKMKKMDKQLRQVMEAYSSMEFELREMSKRAKGKKHKHKHKKKKQQIQALDLQRQQQLLAQEVLANVLLKILGSATVSVNYPPSHSQSAIALPSPRDDKK